MRAPKNQRFRRRAIIKYWNIYSSEELGFKIDYPKDWTYKEWPYEESGRGAVGFNSIATLPQAHIGGYQWYIATFDRDQLGNKIAEMGDQFEDRQATWEIIQVNEDLPGILVTVTTNQVENWALQALFVQTEEKLFMIENGAVPDENFETFYKSFELL